MSSIFSGVFGAGQISADKIVWPVNTVTNDYTPALTDYLILADGTDNTVTIGLPAANTVAGKSWRIKAINITNTVKVTASENIDGTAGATGFTYTSQYEELIFYSDGTQYWIFSY